MPSHRRIRLPHPPGPANYNRWLGLTWRHAYRLWADPLSYATDAAQRYGDLSSFLLFHRRAYIANHPALLHELLVKRRDDFRKARWQTRVMREVLGDGLLLSEGDAWLRQRRLLQQAFRPTLLSDAADAAVGMTSRLVDAWTKRGSVDLVSEMAALSMSLSIHSTVGLDPFDREGTSPQELSAALIEGADVLKRDMENPLAPPDWAPLESRRRKRAALHTLNSYLNRAIETRRASPGRYADILALLLGAVDTEGDGHGMADRQARDEAATMLLAGSHASGAALGWLWKLVLSHPRVHQRLIEEADLVLQGRAATFADLPDLTYTKQVVQETLRLFPAAWVLFCREAVRETSLGGYRVRRGGWVFAYPFVTHRDPRFFPDPLRFDPERFSPGRIGEIPTGAYFPFGHGPRNCIGQHLALMHLVLITATVLERCRLTPTLDCEDLAISRDLSIRPATPCLAAIAPRCDFVEVAPRCVAMAPSELT
ncbi:MAG: cytochrome P450 [Planctomycetales bacterium]|nr:cytochrome P450 [Planctomycetales bacterium]